jgi:hypothetical protein
MDDEGGEALACEKIGADGTPYPAYLSGAAEIAIHLPETGRWLLLSVNSGRHEDAVRIVMALREAQWSRRRAAGQFAEYVKRRLDSWPPVPLTASVAPWAPTLWRAFKLKLVADLALADCSREAINQPEQGCRGTGFRVNADPLESASTWGPATDALHRASD